MPLCITPKKSLSSSFQKVLLLQYIPTTVWIQQKFQNIYRLNYMPPFCRHISIWAGSYWKPISTLVSQAYHLYEFKWTHSNVYYVRIYMNLHEFTWIYLNVTTFIHLNLFQIIWFLSNSYNLGQGGFYRYDKRFDLFVEHLVFVTQRTRGT
jgi:hypothetical protein